MEYYATVKIMVAIVAWRDRISIGHNEWKKWEADKLICNIFIRQTNDKNMCPLYYISFPI